MTARAARRSTTRRPAPKKRPQRRANRPGLLDQAMAALPFGEKTLRRIATWGIVGLVVAGLIAVAAWMGLLSAAGVAVAEQVGAAGLQVRQIEVTGLKRMDRMTVYAQALDQKSRAMPLVDLAGVRERLLRYPWVEDARVSRRLPDTLLIHIVERQPVAVWQNRGRLMLVDAKGVPLDAVSREAMPDLPLLIGDNANLQEDARRRLIEAAPALKPVIRAASWIGNRRWDLTFETGERLQLPEGEAASVAALAEFAERDASYRLLGRGFTRFDMRDSRNFTICCRPEPVPAPVPAAGNSEG